MIPGTVLLALGDSIVWGLGLKKKDKFCTIVAKRLGMEPLNHAHGGATSVAVGEDPESEITKPDYFSPDDQPTGEVSRSIPTVLEQCSFYKGEPDLVRYILIDGGINDVNIFNILNPIYPQDQLERSIARSCRREMASVLRQVVTKFKHPECKIVVTGYYPIISERSDPARMTSFLLALLPIFPQVHSQRTDLRLQSLRPWANAVDFWKKSDKELKCAVKLAGDSRVVFVPSGFREENALFAGKSSFLREPAWNLSNPLEPDDPMLKARKSLCEKYEKNSVDCFVCSIGSLGHPTESGAMRYANMITDTIENWPKPTKAKRTTG
jgi:lysophospholipase L1-like esterase